MSSTDFPKILYFSYHSNREEEYKTRLIYLGIEFCTGFSIQRDRKWAYEKYSIFGKSVDDMCQEYRFYIQFLNMFILK
jgi:hypothetical protein